MADPCQTLAAQLAALEASHASMQKQQQKDLIGLSGAAKAAEIKQHMKELKALEAQIAAKKAQLAACLQTPIPLVPITVGVKGLSCVSDTTEVGDDEPYVLAYAVDLAATTNVSFGGTTVAIPFPRATADAVGQWEDVQPGPFRSASELPANKRRPFWNLTGAKQLIAQPTNVVFLVALMENDNGVAASVATALQGIMAGVLATAPNSPRPTLVSALINGMQGAIGPATLAGTKGLNLDDQIGSVAELPLTAQDLLTVAHLGTHTKQLTFSGDGGLYTVEFELKS